MVGTLSGSSSGPAQNGVAQRIFDEQDLGTNASALESQKHDFGSEDSKGPRKATPLPKVQLLTLCAVRLVDPIAFTQIFPYVNEMMERLHLTKDPSKIGFYSGMVVSAVSLELCSQGEVGAQLHRCFWVYRRAASRYRSCAVSTTGPRFLVGGIFWD